jgi:hypothetical protein
MFDLELGDKPCRFWQRRIMRLANLFYQGIGAKLPWLTTGILGLTLKKEISNANAPGQKSRPNNPTITRSPLWMSPHFRQGNLSKSNSFDPYII